MLGDVYFVVDFIMYLSFYEGFGNVFLEVFYYWKFVFVNWYLIFIMDIEFCGF